MNDIVCRILASCSRYVKSGQKFCSFGDYQEAAKSRRVAEFMGRLYGGYDADNLMKAMKVP